MVIAILLSIFAVIPARADWIREPSNSSCIEIPNERTVEEVFESKKAENPECKILKVPDTQLYMVRCGKQLWTLSKSYRDCIDFNRTLEEKDKKQKKPEFI